jgi:threonine synthase
LFYAILTLIMAPTIESSLTNLHCPECGRHFPADDLQTYCHDCLSPLLADYDLEALRSRLSPLEIRQRPRGIWRWAELLPVRKPEFRLTLGEGDTPLLHLPHLASDLGLANLFLKDDGMNPTGSFKARGLAVAVGRGLELGVTSFVIPTAGNAGGALAAYAGHAGVEAHVYMPKDAPRINQIEVQLAGADLKLVDGLINDAARLAASDAGRAGWFDVSTLKEPYRLEGKKTMGFELIEAFNLEMPDVIIYPTGGGTGLIGMWKAFNELEALGWIGSERPRMVSVQAEGCAPIVQAFTAKSQRTTAWEGAHTIAAGLRVPVVFAGRLILRVLYESGGRALAVSDEEILASQKKLAEREGIFAAPEGSATLTALIHLLSQGWISAGEKVVLYNTGSGLKYVS